MHRNLAATHKILIHHTVEFGLLAVGASTVLTGELVLCVISGRPAGCGLALDGQYAEDVMFSRARPVFNIDR